MQVALESGSYGVMCTKCDGSGQLDLKSIEARLSRLEEAVSQLTGRGDLHDVSDWLGDIHGQD